MVFSTFVRRTHMYVALFFMPWVLFYALSTLVMNHRAFFRGSHAGGSAVFEKESEFPFSGQFAEGATPKQKALQILSGLNLEGAHTVRVDPAGRLIVLRQGLVTPRRITYSPATGALTVERESFRSPVFLERLHRRRGYQSDYFRDDAWAFTVDTVIAAMIVWAVSGLWMWWEMRATRRWGVLATAGGLALFGLFLATI